MPQFQIEAAKTDLFNNAVWSHAKRTGVARSPLKAGENLQCRVDAQLQNIANNPALVQTFFRHPSISYITDW